MSAEGQRCAICDKAASSKCAGCWKAYYCTRDHQRSHWPRHKKSCVPLVLQHSKELGHYVTASKPFKQGSTIFQELPLAVWPTLSNPMDGGALCMGCCKRVTAEHTCPKCRWPLCGPQCPGDIQMHQRGECIAGPTPIRVKEDWSNPDKRGLVAMTYDLVGPMRLLLMKLHHADVFGSIMALESNADYLSASKAWETDQTVIYLKKLSVLERVDDDEIERVKGIVASNAFSAPTGPDPDGWDELKDATVLYQWTSRIQHDCQPNATYDIMPVEDKFKIHLRAARDIAKGEAVSISYTGIMEGTRQRRAKLFAGKFFWCTCKRCSDPTELGTEMSTLVCQHCRHEGRIAYARCPTPLEVGSDYVCESCGSHIPVEEVVDRERTIERQVRDLNRDENDPGVAAQRLESLIAEGGRLLHPTNYVLVAAKESLARMITFQLSRIEPSKRREHHKLHLRLLDVVDEVLSVGDKLRGSGPKSDPDIGFLLLSWATSKLSLIQNQAEKEVSRPVILQALQRACDSLQESRCESYQQAYLAAVQLMEEVQTT